MALITCRPGGINDLTQRVVQRKDTHTHTHLDGKRFSAILDQAVGSTVLQRMLYLAPSQSRRWAVLYQRCGGIGVWFTRLAPSLETA